MVCLIRASQVTFSVMLSFKGGLQPLPILPHSYPLDPYLC